MLRADPPTTAPLEAQRAEERKGIEKQYADAPVLLPAKLSDAVSFQLNKNDLMVYTRLAPTNGPARLNLPELPGICVMDTRGPQPRLHQPYTPVSMLFIHFDFSKPGTSISSTTVQVTPMNVQVSQDMEWPGGGVRQVSLVQNLPGINDSEAPVRMSVSLIGNPSEAPATQAADANNDGSAMVKIEHTAPDFVTLRRQYPGDAAKYLEPIFRELHADATLFGPDPKLAWQVFLTEAPETPQVTQQVKRIVAQLDSDDVHERDAAAAHLAELGDPAAVSLMHMDRSAWSPEQSSRVDAFLSSYRLVSDEDAHRLRDDVNFLLDCLYDTDDFTVHCALKRLGEITGHPVAFDASLRDEARRNAVNTLREQLAPTTPKPVK